MKRIMLLSSLLLLTACGGFEAVLNDPQIITQETHLTWITPDAVQLNAAIRIENPNPVTMSISRALCSLTINGKKITPKSFEQLPILQGYHSTIIDFPIQFNRHEFNQYFKNQQTAEIEVAGYVYPTKDWEKSQWSFYGSSSLRMPEFPELIYMKSHINQRTNKKIFVLKLINHDSQPLEISKITGYACQQYKKFSFHFTSKKKVVLPQQTKFILLKTVMPADQDETGLFLSGEVEIYCSEKGTKIILPIPSPENKTP